MLSFMNITKALSDENRIRILMALHANDELCVCNINELLELAPFDGIQALVSAEKCTITKGTQRWALDVLPIEPRSGCVRNSNSSTELDC